MSSADRPGTTGIVSPFGHARHVAEVLMPKEPQPLAIFDGCGKKYFAC